MSPSDVLEIEVRQGEGRWVKVHPWIFRSWTGNRRINGVPHEGPVYYLGSDKVSRPGREGS